jgi:hypothetical protein
MTMPPSNAKKKKKYKKNNICFFWTLGCPSFTIPHCDIPMEFIFACDQLSKSPKEGLDMYLHQA